jgi:predicted Zn finger-like uncharacterized protein
MIVQCENCETRFHVADARIPEKGARVRCSRCHHRFHITPSSGTSAGPSPSGDVSARDVSARTISGRTAGDAPGEDELDNPEFLFEGNSSDPGQKTPPRAKQAAPPAKEAAPPEPTSEPEPEPEPEPEAPKPPSPDLEPAAAPEERIVATRGGTAQEMLDAGAPKLDGVADEFAPSLQDSDSDDTRSRIFLGDDPPAPEREAAPSLRPAKDKPAKPSFTKPSSTKSKAPPAPEIDAAFGAGASDEEEGDAGWEALTKDAEPANVFEAGASFGLATTSSEPVAEARQSQVTLLEPEAEASNTKKRRGREAAPFDPEAPSSLGTILRVAACLVGVALLAGTLRGLQMQREASAKIPEAEQSAGWTATDVETFVARDSLGVRVLVVRGNLFPNGPASPPEVEVSLLESDGRRVGEPQRAWLERLDDAEIAPDELSVRLASESGEISGAGPQVTGFTALLPDPPARARRVQVTLLAGKLPPRGTATAVTPAPPAPAPDSQLAAPQAPPPKPSQLATPRAPVPKPSQLATPQAPAPQPSQLPPESVVPAAPEPE